MGVKCDHCDRDATVHEVLVRNGTLTERHLCEHHAAQLGIMGAGAVEGANVAGTTQASGSGSGKGSSSELMCPSCGTTFAQFRKHGLLGCPDCYATFEDRLTPLLKRAHEGNDRHTGRVPASAGSSERKRAALIQLRRQLAQALDVEAYEQAAGLRDQIARLESQTFTQASEAGGGARIDAGGAERDPTDQP